MKNVLLKINHFFGYLIIFIDNSTEVFNSYSANKLALCT